jgi:hypothetical protein
MLLIVKKQVTPGGQVQQFGRHMKQKIVIGVVAWLKEPISTKKLKFLKILHPHARPLWCPWSAKTARIVTIEPSETQKSSSKSQGVYIIR